MKYFQHILKENEEKGIDGMIKYYKLFDLLNRRGMKKTDLLEIISAPTLAKLSKGDTIKTDIIDKICEYLDCQPGDIMEYVPEEILKEEKLTFLSDVIIDEMYERYDIYHDLITREDMKELIKKCVNWNKKKLNQDKLVGKIKDLHAKRFQESIDSKQ